MRQFQGFALRGRSGTISRWAIASVATLILAVGCWLIFPQPPAPIERRIGKGVVYHRLVRSQPRPFIAHLIWADLANADLRFLVTPREYSGSLPFAAMTVEEFVERYDLLAAINGDYFQPWHNDTPLDYYPRRNDPVATMGPSASNGTLIEPSTEGYFSRRRATLFISRDRKVQFETPPSEIYHCISGGPILIREGEIAKFRPSEIHPQTAVGYDSLHHRLLLIVVDGRQPNYSEGLTNLELAELLLELGCDWGLRLDGGGSSTMAAKIDGKVTLLNSPVHSGIPGSQRPVANHLGLYISENWSQK